MPVSGGKGSKRPGAIAPGKSKLDYGIFGYVNTVIESDEIVSESLEVRKESEHEEADPDALNKLVRPAKRCDRRSSFGSWHCALTTIATKAQVSNPRSAKFWSAVASVARHRFSGRDLKAASTLRFAAALQRCGRWEGNLRYGSSSTIRVVFASLPYCGGN